MKTAILAFAAVAAALPATPLRARQEIPSTSSSTTQPESLVDAIPINIVTSLRRPNGDVIGILKPRDEASDAVDEA
ncbi:hypothetical protein MBLNU13_g03065t1 [Cladosporium sp. NU13]